MSQPTPVLGKPRNIDTVGSPPPSSDVAEPTTSIATRRHTEHNQLERTTHSIHLAASR